MIICYVKTDEICYALKYDCYTGSEKNAYLVKLNTDRNKIIDEYSVTGEIIHLSLGDVCRLYQGGDKVYLSINNADIRQFNLPNSNQLQQDRPFEFHPFFVNNNFINVETEPACVSIIDSERFYTHQNKTYEIGKEKSTNAEFENISYSTDLSSSTKTENASDVMENSIAVTTDSKEYNKNSSSKTLGIISSIILLLLIIATSFFLYLKFLKDKLWTIFPHKGEDSTISEFDRFDNSQKKIRIKNESTLVANAALKYPIDRKLTNQDLADEKDEFIGKKISQIECVKFRYKINHRDYVYVECFKSGVNIANVLSNYRAFLLAFSQNYELIVGVLEKSDCITIKRLYDYSLDGNISVDDLLTLLSSYSHYRYNSSNGIFRQMIELLKATTSLLYNDTGANNSAINKICLYSEQLGIDTMEAACKKIEVIDINLKIKAIISILIELYMAKPQNADFRLNAWNSLENRILELLNLFKDLGVVSDAQSIQQVHPDIPSKPAANEADNEIYSAINQLNSSPMVCLNSQEPVNNATTSQTTCKAVMQTSERYQKKNDFMELYHNTDVFLSSEQDIHYFSPSNDSTVFNSESYTLEVASYNWAADFIAIGNKLFLNPNKYKNAYLDELQRKDLRLDVIFNISGFNGRGNFSSIEPAIVELNTLKVVSTGKLRFK